jgi:hypothetical protein
MHLEDNQAKNKEENTVKEIEAKRSKRKKE